MASVDVRRSGELAYREAAPAAGNGAAAVLLLHGFPESSWMWAPLMSALGDERRCLAPDLYCLGDSRDRGPATFERNLEAVERFHSEQELGRTIVVVHDWGGFVGLAWAATHRDQVAALVISDTGFFSDGRWHGMAQAMRGEQGEELIGGLDRDGFAGLLRGGGEAFGEEDIDAYWRPFEAGRGREATLEFYRSMDFSKLAPYEGALAQLGVPTLLLWGAEDPFAPLAGAKRFEREIPGAELVAIEGAGHFIYDEQPQRCVEEIVAFLRTSR